MSLQTNVNVPGKSLDGAVDKKEKKARNFAELVREARKREALAYFNQLDEETRRYIEKHEEYGWMLKAAQMQF